MIQDGKKWCNAHKDWADITLFNRRSASPDGLSRICRNCQHAYNRQHNKKKSTKVKQRQSNLRIHYNITLADYRRMWVEQNGECAICHETGHKLNVDHNHRTGEVRRLLCSGCNHGLGRFKDDPELCREAARYLEVYGH